MYPGDVEHILACLLARLGADTAQALTTLIRTLYKHICLKEGPDRNGTAPVLKQGSRQGPVPTALPTSNQQYRSSIEKQVTLHIAQQALA